MSNLIGRASAALWGFSGGRRGWAFAVAGILFALGALAAALAPWTFSNAALLETVGRQLQSSTGLFVAAKGRAVFALLPRPHVAFEGMVFADPDAALTIEAERLRGDVDILSLLAGRLEISHVDLIRPRFAIDLDRRPMRAAGAPARAASTRPATPDARRSDRERLGVLTVRDGTARLLRGGVETVVDNIEGSLDWRRVGDPATLLASFSWHGEKIQTLLWIARPGELLRGEQTPVTARWHSDSLRLEGEGFGQISPKPHFSGRLSGSAPSLLQALGLFRYSVPLPAPFANLQGAARVSVSPGDLQLSGLKFVADDNQFEGSVFLREEDGRPILQATLSTPFVSLKSMLADAPALVGPDGQWSREPFELPDLAGADVDLSLAAAHARIGRLSIDDAHLGLTLRGGRLDIALDTARAYKGLLKARAAFAAKAGNELEFQATAQTQGVDAGALLWDAAARHNLSGSLDATLELDATGDSVAAMTHDLDGRANLVLSQGELTGVDLERALRRLDKRPLSSVIDIRTGRSRLDKATATVKIVKGVANVEDGAAHGPGFALTFAGAARVPERALTLKGQANEADGAGKPRDKGMQIGFDISGNWDDLAFAPDAQALIKRSGAAAPLLRVEPQTPQDGP